MKVNKNEGEKRSKVYTPWFVLALVFFILLLIFMYPDLTGHVILDLNASYVNGSNVTGNLNIIVKSGELIPKDSKLYVSLGNYSSEFSLEDLIDSSLITGDFYAEGTNINGNGEGFGLIGKKNIYPELSFKLGVFDSINGGSDSYENEIIVEGKVSKENNFDYNIEAGKNYRVLSVEFNGSLLSNNSIDVAKESGKLVVSTDYSYEEEGFGKEYLGDDEKIFSINLEELNIIAVRGNLEVELAYNGEQIARESSPLSVVFGILDVIFSGGSSNVTFVSPTPENNSVIVDGVKANVLFNQSLLLKNYTYYLYNSTGLVATSKYKSDSIISVGYNHFCFLTIDGNVKCFGSNIFGQANNYTGGDAVEVCAGNYYTCILKNTGDVQCYGQQTHVTRGGTLPNRWVFNYSLHDVIGLSCNQAETCLLKSSGDVQCYGDTDSYGPDYTYTGGDAIGVSAEGTNGGCVLRKGGNVTCKIVVEGSSNYTGGDAIGVSAAYYHYCVLRSNGNVTCTGYSEAYTKNYTGGDAVGIATGNTLGLDMAHSCYLRSNGNVTCYGNDFSGATANYTGGDAIAIAAGPGPSMRYCIIKNDGNVQCITNGYNYTGGDAKRTAYYIFRNISSGNYSLNASAYDSTGSISSSETRIFNLTSDSVYPIFQNYTDNSNALYSQSSVGFSSLVNNTNGSVFLVLNNVAYPVNNVADNNYTTVINFSANAVYEYYWAAYGNGIGNRYNISDTHNFTMIFPLFSGNALNFTSPTPQNGDTLYGTSMYINVTNNNTDRSYSLINLDDTLEVWYTWYNLSTSNVVDYSGNLINGVLNGEAYADSSGIFGDAVHFNGTNGYMIITNPLTTKAYTLSLWFNSSESYGTWISTISTPAIGEVNKYQSQFGLYNGKVCHALGMTSNQTAYCTSFNYNDSQWHHAAVTFNGTTVNLYIDGVLNYSGANNSILSEFAYIMIGNHPSNGAPLWDAYNGSLDELTIFSRVLDANEISYLYNSSSSMYTTFSGLSYGSHRFNAYSINEGETGSETEVRVVNLVNPNSATGGDSSGGSLSSSALSNGQCSDSDGGRNYYSDGITAAKINGTFLSYSDKCSEGILTEYYCSSSSLVVTKYACSEGCSGNSCVRPKKVVDNLFVAGQEITSSGGGYNSGLVERLLCGEMIRQSPINASADEEYPGFYARYAIDGNVDTRWHGNFDSAFPKSIVFDYGKKMCLKSVDLYFHEWDLPITTNLYVSNDGTTWDKVISDNSFFLPRTIGVNLPKTIVARYVKIEETSSSRTHGELSEIQFLSGEYNETRGRSLKLR